MNNDDQLFKLALDTLKNNLLIFRENIDAVINYLDSDEFNNFVDSKDVVNR